MGARGQVPVTVLTGLIAIGVALLVVLLQAPDRVLSSNSVFVSRELSSFRKPTTVCQPAERIPAATSALRVSLGALAHPGPAISSVIVSDGQIVTTGHRGAGWVGGAVAVPLQHILGAPATGTICFRLGFTVIPLEVAGGARSRAPPASANSDPLGGRVRIEYLAQGRQSWLSLAENVARRLGLGHSPSGTWIVLAIIAMAATAIALGASLLIREPPDG
jgi:hypothetical protein